MSHLVCKHHNEWAYSGQYLSPLIEELDQFYVKALKKDADGKELENQQELDAIKEERKEAFKAKVEQLALWEGIEARKSSYRSKWVNGALVTSPIAIGTYLTYKFGKWIYEKMTSEDEPEQEIRLSPFPIANPVVYHFHPVAFVEQMRRYAQSPKFPVSVDQLKSIFPNSTDERRNEVEEAINKYSNDFEIDNIDRMAHLLGQIGTETGELMHLKENYNYSAKTIYNIFLKRY